VDLARRSDHDILGEVPAPIDGENALCALFHDVLERRGPEAVYVAVDPSFFDHHDEPHHGKLVPFEKVFSRQVTWMSRGISRRW